MEIKILKAQLPDLEIIQDLAYEIWPVYYANIISLDQIEYMLGILYNVDALNDQMEKGQRFFLVNEDERFVGFFGMTFYQNKGLKIDKLYLKEECRGKGYGRQLIDFVVSEGKKIPTNFLFLNVNRFNESLAFYKKNGFEIVENLDIPFGPFWLNDFIMKKPI